MTEPNREVERFSPKAYGWGAARVEMEVEADGQWVHHSDYEKLAAMNARLNSREAEQALVARQEKARADKAEAERDQARQALRWFKDFAEAEGDEAMLDVATKGLAAKEESDA